MTVERFRPAYRSRTHAQSDRSAGDLGNEANAQAVARRTKDPRFHQMSRRCGYSEAKRSPQGGEFCTALHSTQRRRARRRSQSRERACLHHARHHHSPHQPEQQDVTGVPRRVIIHALAPRVWSIRVAPASVRARQWPDVRSSRDTSLWRGVRHLKNGSRRIESPWARMLAPLSRAPGADRVMAPPACAPGRAIERCCDPAPTQPSRRSRQL